MAIEFPIAILKPLFMRLKDGRWGITDLKGLELTHDGQSNCRYFELRGDLQLMTNSPRGRPEGIFSAFGTTEFLMQQSIVPVVTWIEGEDVLRCVGTGTIISCTGYVLTAAHVVMAPIEEGYGGRRVGNSLVYDEKFHFGVLIPINPISGVRGFLFFPFEKFWSWAKWLESPLIHEPDKLEYLTDIAICKIPRFPDDRAHQPLSMSLNPFVSGEDAYALGYAEMSDIRLNPETGALLEKPKLPLYVSAGNIMTTFPQNHKEKEVPAPGPCFDFNARIPGKMSGAPVFGARGIIIRGVVSRSFSEEEHAYGSMLGPAMDLPLSEPGIDNRSLRSLLDQGEEGMPQVYGEGL